MQKYNFFVLLRIFFEKNFFYILKTLQFVINDYFTNDDFVYLVLFLKASGYI